MILIKKIEYKLRKLFSGLLVTRINWGSLFWSLFFILIIAILGMNIFTAFSKGLDTAESFAREKKKLEELQQENDKLEQQYNEYQSIEFKKIYARENLNLAERNESLFYIDRPKEQVEIEGLPEQKMEITLEDNISFWKKLILGL